MAKRTKTKKAIVRRVQQADIAQPGTPQSEATPDIDLEAIWEYMTGSNDERETALSNAVNVAALTIPTIEPRGTKINDKPYTPMGTLGLRSLASSITDAMLPAGAMAYDLDLPPATWDLIEEQHKDIAEKIQKRLDDRKKDIHDALLQKTARSRLASATRRNLVEGTTVFVNRPDRLDVFPLRSIAVERESGMPRIVMMQQEITPDPMTITRDKKPAKEDNYCIYWLANFTNGQVWRQEGKQAPKRLDNLKPDDPDVLNIRQIIVMVGEIPDIGDYPEGYENAYLRLFTILDNIDSSLGEAMSIAAWSLLRLRSGSAIALEANTLRNRPSGSCIVADKDDMEWQETGVKLADFAFLAQLRNILSDDVAKTHAMGLKDRPTSGDTTATEVLEIVKELDKQTQDLLSSIEETFLRPLIESESYLQERKSPIFKGLPAEFTNDEVMKVSISSGANALEKQRFLARFILQVLPMLMKMDPMMKVDGTIAADTFTQSRRALPAGLYRRLSPQEQMLMLQAQMTQQAGGQPAAGGKREEPIRTAGGTQPKQPDQPLQPVPA